MNEAESIAFYVKRLAETARAMPLREALAFLRGALCLAGDSEAIAPIRATYLHLRDSDAQLELIASGQLKLNLGEDGQNSDGQKGDGNS